jgi:TetR/AcrR family transcriptional regulator
MRTAEKKAPPVRKRREQQRALETRDTILRAALAEFADKGYDGASIRAIADRTELQHQLITYHFKTKEILWKAVAGHVFERIRTLWDERAPEGSNMTPIGRVREQYRTVFNVSLEFADFHHFMLRESRLGSPRMPWLAEKFLKPLMARLLTQIAAAQAEGDLPPGDPVLLHYMLIGMTTALSSLGGDMAATSGRSPENPAVVANYWTLLEVVLLNKNLAHEKSN